MKYISLLLFTFALGWTWHLVHSDSPISFETHSGIQEKLATLIVDTIKAKRSSASDIVIQKMWTEVISPEKVKAFFVYSFKDVSESGGTVTSEIKGEGLLEHQGEDAEGNDRWVLSKVHTSNDAIQFEEATLITNGPNDTSAESKPNSEAPAQEKPTQEEHQ
jgi:hypothetical protein